MTRFQAILFDLDGTLVDSAPDMAFAINQLMTELNLPMRSLEEVRTWVGNGAKQLVARALTGEFDGVPHAGLLEETLTRYQSLYGSRLCADSQLYSGVIPTLDHLHALDIPLAVVTNKPIEHARLLIDQIGLAPYFTVVLGGDQAPRKPEPDLILMACDQLGVSADQCLMVGDSINDVEAAHRANMSVAVLPYGYNHGQPIAQSGAHYQVNQFTDLMNLI